MVVALLFCFLGVMLLLPILFKQWQAWQQQKLALQTALKAAQVENENLQVALARSQEEVQQSIEDPVTRLPGWRIFSDRLSHQVRESERHHTTMGVMFIDINHFKMVNDALGTAVGDAVLLEIAKRLATCVRQVDSLSRFSKDTFVVLLSQLAKPETAVVVAQRVLQAIGRPFQIEGQEINLSACIGMALFPQDAKEAATLLRNADDALQLAKTKGKQVYQFYQEKMQEQSQRELILYTQLARESTLSEFAMLYQPIVNVREKSIECLEASFCWHQEALGDIEYPELVYYAEKQHKLNKMTEALLFRACDQFLRWHAVGFRPKSIGIPMKISQLESSQFVYRLSQQLQALTFPCDQLVVSLDEDIKPVSFDVLEKSFNMLSYLGVKICLNHFGCGGMSLRYLKNLKVDYIKLDQSFIDDVTVNEYAKALINSLIMLADNMGIKVIASGVEVDDQLSTLNNLNCSLMQGKLLGIALPEMQVESAYATRY